MAQQAEGTTRIEEFKGLTSNMGRHSMPPGGAEKLENLSQLSEGRLDGRQGLKPLSYDN